MFPIPFILIIRIRVPYPRDTGSLLGSKGIPDKAAVHPAPQGAVLPGYEIEDIMIPLTINQLISEQAVQVLQDAEIAVDYDTVVPNIINRDGTDICPIEKLTMNISEPDIAFEIIREFLINNNIIES